LPGSFDVFAVHLHQGSGVRRFPNGSGLLYQGIAAICSLQLRRESSDGRKQTNEDCRIVCGRLTDLIERLFNQTRKEQGTGLQAQLSVRIEPTSATLRRLGQNRQGLSEQVHGGNAREGVVDCWTEGTNRNLDDLSDTELKILGEEAVTSPG
jgi:hypothetical protein